MSRQISDAEASRDEIVLCTILSLTGIIAVIAGAYYAYAAGSFLGIFTAIGGATLTITCIYTAYNRLRRFAEARQTALWLLLIEIFFP